MKCLDLTGTPEQNEERLRAHEAELAQISQAEQARSWEAVHVALIKAGLLLREWQDG